MKKTSLGIFVVLLLILPSFSHAQFTPFGGLYLEPMPFCDCTPVALDGQSAYEAACVMLVALPPTFFFELFALLWIGSGVPFGGGFLAQLIAEPALAYPDFALLPNMWALGELIPDAQEAVCGFALPVVCTHGYDFYPAIMCAPITLPVYGIVTPFTGTAPFIGY